jgi:peptide deformylase
MAVRKIQIYQKDKMTLRKNSAPVPAFSRQTRRLIEDLKDTLLVHHNFAKACQFAAHQMAEMDAISKYHFEMRLVISQN